MKTLMLPNKLMISFNEPETKYNTRLIHFTPFFIKFSIVEINNVVL